MNYRNDWQTLAEIKKRKDVSDRIIAEQVRALAELFSKYVPEADKPTIILSWDEERAPHGVKAR